MLVINSSIAQTKFAEFGVDVEIEEGTVFCGSNAGEKLSRGTGGCDGFQVKGFDVCGGGNVKYVDLTILGFG